MTRFFYYAGLTTPLGLLFVASVLNSAHIARKNVWGNAGAWVLLVYTLCLVGGLFLLERIMKVRAARILRAKGKDPDKMMLQMGIGCLLAPSTLSFMGWMIGGMPIAYFYFLCSVSFFGVYFWGKRYKMATK